MDALACEMTSDFNKETVKREPLIARGTPLKQTDDREKDARMKLLDRRISVAPMMAWSDGRDSR
jgi:hypothetical protein